jgi:signal transduction histidine kinase
MKKIAPLKRFLVASLLISLSVPLLYHTVQNYTRREYYANLTKEVCKAVEPNVQTGHYRGPIEYAQGMMLRQGFGYTPAVVFFDHGQEITPHHASKIGEIRIDCEFAGIENARMSIFYQAAPLLNVRYVYLYLFCIPIFFAIFIFIRILLDRFQRQVVDVVQAQIKRLMDLEGSDEKPRGVIGQLLDLNIPLLGYLKAHIDGLEGRLAEYSRKVAEQKRAEVLSDVAAQVAHDIVAPLSTLQAILTSSSGNESEDRKLIHEELERMKALAEKMLRQYRGETEPERTERFSLTNLASVILVEAKAMAAGRCEVALEIEDDIFVEGVKSDLSAALSNIVKNAIESIDRLPGRVVITVTRAGNTAKITIKDTGCGIPPENQKRIFKKDVSYKRGGTGLGLFQAHSAVAAMSGKIDLHSVVGQGTVIEIELPIAGSEKEIIVGVSPDTHLTFVDDDKVVHEVWRRVSGDFPAERTHFFFTGEAFRLWLIANHGTKSINFVDHDIEKNGGETGIEFIERCQVTNSSFLVTCRSAEESIKNLAQTKCIRLIDKADQGRIRFRVEKSCAEIILIDDARANRIAWSAQAKRAGRAIETFESAEAFFILEAKFDRSTPIYVDYLFYGVPMGTVVAERLVKAGFSNVFLATAYPREKTVVPAGVRGVVGKEFPG